MLRTTKHEALFDLQAPQTLVLRAVAAGALDALIVRFILYDTNDSARRYFLLRNGDSGPAPCIRSPS